MPCKCTNCGDPEPERILLPEAERITGLCARTLQQLSCRGEIWGAAKLGRRWTYDRMRLRAWIAAKESTIASRATSTSAAACFTAASRSKDASIGDPLERAIAEKLKQYGLRK